LFRGIVVILVVSVRMFAGQCQKSITHVSPKLHRRRGSGQLVTNLLVTRPTSWQQVVVMEIGKRHDTTDFCPLQFVTNLLRTSRKCCGLVMDYLLWGSRQLVTDCYGETGVIDFRHYFTADCSISTTPVVIIVE